MTSQRIIYHPLIAKHCPIGMDLDIMRRTGFDGIEVTVTKLRQAREAGLSDLELARMFDGVSVPGIGFLPDVERQDGGRKSLLAEAEEIFSLANLVGARAVQILTGPVDVQAVRQHSAEGRSELYKGVLGLPYDEQIEVTAQNVALLADRAADHGLLLYLEALGWAPLNSVKDMVRLIDAAGRDNLKLLVDFWHCYVAGDTPEDIASLDPLLIYGVHVCDSRPFAAGVPDETILRDVATGSGVIDLVTWVEAVKSTGYVGWWSPELFHKKQQVLNGYEVAGEMRDLLNGLVR